jgi:hypothetical protein
MSALGQKQTSDYVRVMSALPPIADIVATQAVNPNIGHLQLASANRG